MLLAWGVLHTNASSASLLLNFEAVFTVLLAWRLHRESLGRRVLIALGAMVAGGVCLVVDVRASKARRVGRSRRALRRDPRDTRTWALDNTLARPLAELEPTSVVRWKSVLGCTCTLALAFAFGQPFPPLFGIVGLLVCGATGYGLSLRFYLLAQRSIGAGSRTGARSSRSPRSSARAVARSEQRATMDLAQRRQAFFALGGDLSPIVHEDETARA